MNKHIFDSEKLLWIKKRTAVKDLVFKSKRLSKNSYVNLKLSLTILSLSGWITFLNVKFSENLFNLFLLPKINDLKNFWFF